MVKISRRDFLKGSGATALSLMAAGLVGCSTEKEKTPEVTTPTTARKTTKSPRLISIRSVKITARTPKN